MIIEGGTSIGGRVKDWKKGEVRNWKRLLDVSAEKVIFNQSDTQSSTIPTQKKKVVKPQVRVPAVNIHFPSLLKKDSNEEIDESVEHPRVSSDH